MGFYQVFKKELKEMQDEFNKAKKKGDTAMEKIPSCKKCGRIIVGNELGACCKKCGSLYCKKCRKDMKK